MPARLQASDTNRTIYLDKPIVFIGRHPDCDVVINTSRKVSRKHCCLAEIDGQFVVRDLGSTNGIQVNGRRVKGVQKLYSGDELVVGDCRYHFQAQDAMVGQPAGAPRPAAHVVIPQTETPLSINRAIDQREIDPAQDERAEVQPPVPEHIDAELIDHELSSDIPILLDEPYRGEARSDQLDGEESDADGFDTRPQHRPQYIRPEGTERIRKDSSDSHMEMAID